MKTLLTACALLCLCLSQGCEKETPWADEPEVYPWIDGARMGAPTTPCFPPGKPGAAVITLDSYHAQSETDFLPVVDRNIAESFPWIDKP